MSSINLHPTFNYSQPEEYHFSHDSVFMARFVFERYRDKDLSHFSCLDLCAGCGVIGLDFLFHLISSGKPPPKRMDFLEIQEIFWPHILQNQNRFLSAELPRIDILKMNYSELHKAEFHEQYDLILCNPPYFEKNQGKLSQNEIRNRCHFLLDSDEEALVSGILNTLKKDGTAFVLFPDLKDHGVDRSVRIEKLIAGRAQLSKVTEIRGIPLYQITR